MDWLQLILDATGHDADALADRLGGAGALAVTLEDAADQPVYEPAPGEVPLWSQTRVVGLFPSDVDLESVLSTLRAGLGVLPGYYVKTLEDQDWTRAWMDHFHPMPFGRRLWVVPRWMEPPDPDAANVRLDPGLAFGTGTHPTTALCLEWLDSLDLAGKTVIDYGCGSGILAIAAAKLGAAQVWAVDYDAQALHATCENALENGVAERVRTLAPPAVPAGLRADVLVANILARPLIDLAPSFAFLVRPGGGLALSGLLEGQAAEVAQAYADSFDMAAPVVRDTWCRLQGARRPAE